ncbi:DUF2141 domain-containing protein [Crocosphaera chwakensis]|uniref:DUF2141 domain-containing protein n=1 Tax=Crocosphaera chwakensis CCY0110 TaxID=391612 RepID=A3IV32_9CHRO|nr:DUF2141 domain-containing protein [Crocosphaera chwakensis]EAZ89686.1 hypothetical protein CY0110_11247 [Crocosphaera chwakensis CCY0110]
MTSRYVISAFLLPFLGILSASVPANAKFNSNLTVEIDGVSDRQGQICFSLFKSSRGFPDSGNDAVDKRCVKITETPPKITFNDLPPNTYAVAVFWDNNSDGELNRNFLGVPTEKFGFSSNPVIRTGPPKFSDSAILITGKNQVISIKLQSF